MIFRYPGGKTRLLKQIKEYLVKLGFQDGDVFHDVFVGGGSVALAVAEEYPNSEVCVNDLHPWVYSFWRTVLNDDAYFFDELLKRVAVVPTISMFNTLHAKTPQTRLDKAYYAVFFNRTTFSGMFDSGPIGGYEQKSEWKISCRYNPDRLLKDLKRIRTNYQDRMLATNKDGVEYVRKVTDGFMYLDPPYHEKGPMLYRFSEGLHNALQKELRQKKNWLLSYDNNDTIKKYYGDFAVIDKVPMRYSISGKKTDWKAKDELFIYPK